MTVLAAFRSDDIPTLIGDMIVTGAKERPYQRKVYWISPNLVVGWSGYLLTAKGVIKDLLDKFNNRIVRKSELESFFCSHGEEDFGSLNFKIVGWLVDGEQYCFLWNSGFPSEVFYNDSYFEGSGREYFTNVVAPSNMSGSNIIEDTNFGGLLKVLTKTSQALFEEMLYPGKWDKSFGFGYDVFMYVDGQFKGIGPVTHFGWDYHWDPIIKRGRPVIAPIVTKYVNCGLYSQMQKGTMNRKALRTTFRDGIYEVTFNNNSINNGSYALVTPIYDKGRKVGNGIVSSLLADYYANYVLYWHKGHCFAKVALTTGSGEPRQPVWVERRHGHTVIGLNTKWLDEVLEKHNLFPSQNSAT